MNDGGHVWVVTAGYGGDHRVIGVYGSEEAAIDTASRFAYGDYRKMPIRGAGIPADYDRWYVDSRGVARKIEEPGEHDDQVFLMRGEWYARVWARHMDDAIARATVLVEKERGHHEVSLQGGNDQT